MPEPETIAKTVLIDSLANEFLRFLKRKEDEFLRFSKKRRNEKDLGEVIYEFIESHEKIDRREASGSRGKDCDGNALKIILNLAFQHDRAYKSLDEKVLNCITKYFGTLFYTLKEFSEEVNKALKSQHIDLRIPIFCAILGTTYEKLWEEVLKEKIKRNKQSYTPYAFRSYFTGKDYKRRGCPDKIYTLEKFLGVS